MNILVAGGTGFVGKALVKTLNERGHSIYILTRSPAKHRSTQQVKFIDYNDTDDLPDMEVVINLAGESLFGYWTAKKKQSIMSSRLHTTQYVIDRMTKMKQKPNVFINASAIGYYGTSDKVIFTEETTEAGSDFLAQVVAEWEKTAQQAEEMGIRTVLMRFGIILGDGGALSFMRLPIKWFIGGKIASGEQWLSWIHIDDVIKLIGFCLHHEDIKGPINVTAPQPIRNKDFIRILAKVMKRPCWISVPEPLIRLVAGEMSQLITKGQYVLPKKAQKHNFHFLYPHLEKALTNISH